MAQNNIDFIAAKSGFDIVDKLMKPEGSKEGMKPKEIESFINKSLGVLSSNGVYALWLYLKASNKNGNRNNRIDVVKILEECNIEIESGVGGSEEGKIINLSTDIRKLLFAKQVLEQTFIYARYRAKSLNAGERGNSEEEENADEEKRE
ncbi:hypothetical protein MSSIT_1867 [Methanosarcina siciliae T4/M]|uniref:CRISPR type III-B/RAMP module-associated protein Cmr5 n=1 Tax=Methanosarcina siciliae T4/M TaxID=1434120 RepID=A0A0E3L8I6_9EURY|nr:hypothetical protein [Methanosarcina siciliae]AKB28586.1 hypothetical protein MSSIT_1867 [Methanosarcina siciliae T4/M]